MVIAGATVAGGGFVLWRAWAAAGSSHGDFWAIASPGVAGEHDLHNLWPWTKPEKIIRCALTDWLRRSGYLKPEPAVDAVIAQLGGALT